MELRFICNLIRAERASRLRCAELGHRHLKQRDCRGHGTEDEKMEIENCKMLNGNCAGIRLHHEDSI